MSEKKENAAVIAVIAILILAAVGLAYVIFAGYLDELIGGIFLFLLAILVIYIFLHFILGLFYFLDSPDTVHEDSPATLDDIQPVEGSMNSGDKQ
ncbi:MAG: hypothetical protein E7Z63_04160 [Thermoplasmata archaeon]|nr:hypothetical protein [Thermoplasmata archaeon]